MTSGYIFDVYIYLSLDKEWKITALRAMALPGFMRQLYVSLRDKKELSDAEKKLGVKLNPYFSQIRSGVIGSLNIVTRW